MGGPPDGLGGGDAGLAVDAQKADQFLLKMEQCAERGPAGIQVAQGAEKEVKKLRRGMLGLRDELDQLHEVGGHLGAEKIGAQAVKRLDERDLAQGMEIAFAAGGVADLLQEEEVELACEGAARASGAPRDGLEATMVLREPGDNPTGIAEAGTAQEDCGGAVQQTPRGNDSFDGHAFIGKKSLMAEEATQTGAAESNAPAIDTDNLKTAYANVCRIVPTPAEIIVDFGMNPNFFGQVLPEPLKLETRIIMSPDGAKRLAQHLINTIHNYESKYGVIELDVNKRIKPPA